MGTSPRWTSGSATRFTAAAVAETQRVEGILHPPTWIIEASASPKDVRGQAPSPRNQLLVATAARWAERITRKIDNVFGGE